jgi:hypothetical protein
MLIVWVIVPLAVLLMLVLRTRLACKGAMQRIGMLLHREPFASLPPIFQIYLLLPALHEQTLVVSTLDHFSSVVSGEARVSVVVITSESEQQGSGSESSTASLVDDWISANPFANVERLHDRCENGSKSTKLNLAVAELSKRSLYLDPTRVMFGVYDFDSRPHRSTIRELAYLVARGDLPPLVQQIPYTLGKIHRLPAPSVGRMLGIGHLERALALEGEQYRKVDEAHRDGRPPPFLRGCMGAGLFIRADVLSSVGSFPPRSDDITLGYRLDLLRVRRCVLLTPNLVEPPPSALLGFRQMLRIYEGVYTAVPVARNFNAGSISRAAALKAAFTTHVYDAEPAVRLLLIVAALLSACTTGSPAVIAGTVITGWMLHVWLYADLVRYGSSLAKTRADDRPLKLHPVEWLVGPVAQGLLRLATATAFAPYFVFRRGLLRLEGAPTPRIEDRIGPSA